MLILQIYYEYSDLELHEIVENLHYLVHVVSAIVMSVTLFRGTDGMRWLDEKVRSGIFVYPGGHWAEEIELRREAESRVKRISRTLVTIPVLGITLMYVRRFFQNQYRYPLFNMNGWYPFRLTPLTYPAAFVYQFVWLVPATMTWISTLCVFIALSEHLVSHLKIVNSGFARCDHLSDVFNKNYIENINTCIRHHIVLTS